MNLPLPAHQLTLEELHHYTADDPVYAILYKRIEELETELEEEKQARDDDDNEHRSELWDMEQKLNAYEIELVHMETMYDELETRFLALKKGSGNA